MQSYVVLIKNYMVNFSYFGFPIFWISHFFLNYMVHFSLLVLYFDFVYRIGDYVNFSFSKSLFFTVRNYVYFAASFLICRLLRRL